MDNIDTQRNRQADIVTERLNWTNYGLGKTVYLDRLVYCFVFFGMPGEDVEYNSVNRTHR